MASVAEAGVVAGMFGITVIGVDDMARRASAAAIVAGLVVGARHGKERVEKPRLLQAKEDRVSTEGCAETALAELVLGLAGGCVQIGIAQLAALTPTAFKNTQHVAGLRDFPGFEWIEVGQDALVFDFVFGRRGKGNQSTRLAVGSIAFAEARG